MAVGLDQPFELLPIRGIRLASADSGIAYGDRHDLVLMAIEPGSLTTAVFTTNAFCAAPVELARAHLARTAPRFLLINSGNANAGVGDPQERHREHIVKRRHGYHPGAAWFRRHIL